MNRERMSSYGIALPVCAALLLGVNLVHVCDASPAIHAGWPILGGINKQAAVAHDLDGNGTAEVLWGVEGALNIRTHNGQVYPGWPRSFENAPAGPPSIGDLDGDGDLEIVMLSRRSPTMQVSAWHTDGTPVSGWPKSGITRINLILNEASVPLADLDRDGDLELVYGTESTNSAEGGFLHVDHHDGTPATGWPIQFPAGTIPAGPAGIADVDGDGLLDIAVRTYNNAVYVFRHDGTILPGWPKLLGAGSSLRGGPTFADVDADTELELIVTTRGGNVYLFEGTGALMTGWPQDAGAIPRDPAIADLDQDGDLEIVICNEDGLISAYHHNGTPLAGWPIDVMAELNAPVIADIDQDGLPDIVASALDRKLYAWNAQGAPKTAQGFPLLVFDSFGFYGAPCVGDIDGDGLVEVVAMSSFLYAWDLTNAVNAAAMPYPTLRRDALRQGRYWQPPAVTALAPTYLFASTPQPLEIHGGPYLANMQVSLGGSNLAVLAETAGQLTVQLPGGLLPGWHGLTLANANSTSTFVMNALAVFQMVDDDDGDGLPNLWELARGLDPFDDGSVDADHGVDGDPDGDGTPNGDEYAADTNPMDGSDFFRIIGFTGPPNAMLTWSTSTQRVYDVDYAAGTIPHAWQNLATGLSTTNPALSATDPDDSVGRIYRVHVRTP